jgi:hypothetical protein
MAVSKTDELLEALLPSLRVVQGPDQWREYICWCPFHNAGQGGMPNWPALKVSARGFACCLCRAKGSLEELARRLGLDSTPAPVAGATEESASAPVAPAAGDPPGSPPPRGAEVQALGSRETPSTPPRRRRPAGVYRAVFDGLVDVVEADGTPAFLLMGEHGPHVAPDASIGGRLLIPPQRNTMPWLLPRGDAVLAHCDGDSDAELYADLVEYHSRASTLPDPAMYGLLALWDMHTYLLERFHYSPVVCLYAVPERGKTRTGKAMVHVAYRGLHVESLREAYIFRLAAEFCGTLFFDVRDVWRKALREGAEDLLLQRFERGVYVPRVVHPERGPHRHTAFFRVFGPTVIATNHAPDDVLESRGVTIAMPEAAEDFEFPVTAEAALPLKERLVAFRARHVDSELPDAEKPVRGRLGDILRPLAQLCRLVAPQDEPDFVRLAECFEGERAIVRGHSLEATVLVALLALEDEVDKGVIPLRRVAALVNGDRPERERVTGHRLGKTVRALGLRTRRSTSGFVIEYQGAYVRLVARRHGVEAVEGEGLRALADSAGGEGGGQ